MLAAFHNQSPLITMATVISDEERVRTNIFTRTFMSSLVIQNKCLQNPCQNGGTCTESSAGGGFECRCSIGYKGMNCEGQTNICSK